MRVRVCLEAPDTCIPGSLVASSWQSADLFTAPPASAWQLCLPILYLIPPAELSLKEIWPDPQGLQAEACVLTLVDQASQPSQFWVS